MTNLIDEAPSGLADRGLAWKTALAEAREYLAATVEAVNPGTRAIDLLRHVTGYRAHLAAMVAACSAAGQASADDDQPGQAQPAERGAAPGTLP